MHRLYLPYLLHTYICRQVDSTVANQPSVKRIGQHLLSSLNHLTIAIIPSSFNNLLPCVSTKVPTYLIINNLSICSGLSPYCFLFPFPFSHFSFTLPPPPKQPPDSSFSTSINKSPKTKKEEEKNNHI